jgi:hypothetical protein
MVQDAQTTPKMDKYFGDIVELNNVTSERPLAPSARVGRC